MPGSFACFDPLSAELLAWLAPETVLDVGAGAGKYGHLVQRVCPAAAVTALELESDHVDRYALQQVYRDVVVEDAWSWCSRTPDLHFDVVVAGCCVQHLPKSQGLDLLNLLTYRSAWLLVVVPEFVVPGAAPAQASAVQRSVWSERDFHWHDRWAWDNCRTLSWVLLRGYRPSARSMEATVAHLNQARLPVLDFDGQTPVRPAWLRMVDHVRDVNYRVV